MRIMLSDSAQAVFNKARLESEEGLFKMRAAAKELFGGDMSIIIGLNGSYARREVTQGSDIDLFFLFEKADLSEVDEKQTAFRKHLKSIGFKMPAPGGVFEAPMSVDAISQTIGGQDDDNNQITRRMLLLLEGEWIHNDASFYETRTRLLNQYVPKAIRPDQICLFLLNDIIRYWRTICVDFEHKVQKKDNKKARAIRLIKLRFSRMMLFLAGVLAVSETHAVERGDKIAKLEDLLSMPAYLRVQNVAGETAIPALELYAQFLNALDSREIRNVLSQPDGEDSSEFEELRDKAQQFRSCLIDLLHERCADPNPTINALLL